MLILEKSAEAVSSLGFLKAVAYSSISAVLGVLLVSLAKPEAGSLLGNYAVLIPLINSLLVFVKQLVDAHREG